MSENVHDEAWGFGTEGVVLEFQESEELGIVSGATQVHKNAPPDNPAMPMTKEGNDVEKMSESEKIQSGSGHRDAEADKNAEGVSHEEGEKADRPEDEHVKEIEGEEGSKKEVKSGGKRQRPAVKVQKGGEGDAGKETKKAKVVEAEQDESGKKKPQAKRQAKTQAKAKIQETAPKKRGPGRPRKSSGTKKKTDEIGVEGEQKLDAVETPKAVN